MHIENCLVIHADARAVYELAAATERWPQLLPHYRWVHVLERAGNRRVVEMAARRDFIPVWWVAEQVCEPAAPRITFRHLRGVTRGMEVEWRFTPEPGGTRVAISHELRLGWPLIGRPVADYIIGPQFVAYIAGKTLRRFKDLAEARSGGGQT